MMTDEELKDYARYLIQEHATDIEWLSIFEMSEDYCVEEITEEDAHKVSDLLADATIGISWDDD